MKYRFWNLDKDYTILEEWCKERNWESSIPKEMLPDKGKSGFIVEKNNIPIVSGFLYLTNSTGALLEWIVTNPEYREDDRKEAIELLINDTEMVCKNMGITYIFSIGRSKHLMKTHEKLGWYVDKNPSYEITKKL